MRGAERQCRLIRRLFCRAHTHWWFSYRELEQVTWTVWVAWRRGGAASHVAHHATLKNSTFFRVLLSLSFFLTDGWVACARQQEFFAGRLLGHSDSCHFRS